MMKLNNKNMRFILETAEEIEKAAITIDYLQKRRASSDVLYREGEHIENLAFSILMVAMGEHVPKSLWTVKDYANLYTILDDAKDDLEIHDDW